MTGVQTCALPILTERFSKTTSSVRRFESGAYLVVGNAVGENDNGTLFILRDAYGIERDRVQLGGGKAPTGAATGVTDESVSRIPTGSDTDVDTADWLHAPATPGAPN